MHVPQLLNESAVDTTLLADEKSLPTERAINLEGQRMSFDEKVGISILCTIGKYLIRSDKEKVVEEEEKCMVSN